MIRFINRGKGKRKESFAIFAKSFKKKIDKFKGKKVYCFNLKNLSNILSWIFDDFQNFIKREILKFERFCWVDERLISNCYPIDRSWATRNLKTGRAYTGNTAICLITSTVCWRYCYRLDCIGKSRTE